MNSNSPVAWVTGSGGLIGSNLVRFAGQYAPVWRVEGLTRDQLDLTDADAVRQRFQRDRPELIIHCAAISSSVVCQSNPGLARKVNVEVTQLLCELASEIPLVFFSTDLVFDGRSGNYDESAPVNPLGIYAETKVAAERIVLRNSRHTGIRTALTGGTSPTGDRGFNEQLRRGWQAGKVPKLFSDEYRCPIAASVTARAVWELVARQRPGLYHLAGRERLSRWEIGRAVAERWPQLETRIEAGSIKDYQGAPRAADVSLNCARLQGMLSFPLPGLREWLAGHPEEVF